MQHLDTEKWSGEGTFTQTVVEALKEVGDVVAVRVEDAPATRSDADYNFISNEIFVGFATRSRGEPMRRFGFLPGTRVVTEPSMTLVELEPLLAARPDIGPSDYADEGLIQYLKTERIIPPYQTRGYKLVELVRIYRSGTAPDR